IIEIKNLSKKYKIGFLQKEINALNGIDLSIKNGEIFGFLGPNGAGKTTTIKILTGLLYPDSGSVSIFGTQLPDVSLMKRVGYLPEHPFFYSHLTGYELMDFFARIFSVPADMRERRIDRLLEMVDLARFKNLRISKYSKGMVQRLGIAQALINAPDLLIFDEPMEGLDPIGRKDIKAIMLDLKKEGKTIFFSTHILPDVEAVCDRIGIIISGNIIKEGNIDELLRSSISSYTLMVSGIKEEIIMQTMKTTSITKSDELTCLVFGNIEDCNEAIKITQANGGKVISLLPEAKKLEDYFMDVVSRDR
ncbi:MAG: ABC transporter ATP-binding protein, partial [bacterium]